MILKNKKGFEISFSWFFAVVVGGFILFLAIYGATKVINTGGEVNSARTGEEIGILLNPLETGFESGQTTLLTLPVETRINNKCEDITGNFGRQMISVSQKSFGKWSPTDIDAAFQNKYIFSEESIEGKNFFLFSKAFELPFKVADLVYMTSSRDAYCFEDAPGDVKEELADLSQENIFTSDCPTGSKRICFSITGQECYAVVNYNAKEVEKNGGVMYFESDALMYAAVFSDPEIYECQVMRLMGRTSELSSVYIDKSKIISEQGCSNSEVNLFSLRSLTESARDSEDIFSVAREAENVGKENERAECVLW